MIEAIGALLAIILLIIKAVIGKSAEKKKRKESAGNEINQGIDNKDPSQITGGLDDLNKH
jgi:hypothetical protein